MRWLFLLLLMMMGQAQAQNIESALMPGAVIKGHVDAEHDCGKCHVRGDRAAQPGLCMDCHKSVGADVKAGQGYHGRLKDKACRSCHTEHKGRDAKIVKLDTQDFDHTQTDFTLKGKHQGKKCDGCHRAGEVYRKAPSECIACHRKDDKHKGGLGDKCTKCHDENKWKETTFDHDSTKFVLNLSHANKTCIDCHKENRFTNTPTECVACHRKDDKHKGTLGDRCEKCHDEGEWKQPTFHHDRDTHFALLDKHRPVKCESCHRVSPYKEKTPTRCVACHQRDDTHKGNLGDKCEKCHTESGWKQGTFRHDRDTDFPLLDKHRDVKCDKCHKTQSFKENISPRCVSCHLNDDAHKNSLGDKCEKCHDAVGWKHTRFDHNLDTKFPLKDKHATAKCQGCHKDDATHAAGIRTRSPTPSKCVTCHDKDDMEKGHKGDFGAKCESCHNEKSFKDARFNHDTETKFKLDFKHLKAKCSACHRKPLYDNKTDKRCVACHDKDDVHFESYGTDCERCHVSEDWRKVDKDAKPGAKGQKP